MITVEIVALPVGCSPLFEVPETFPLGDYAPQGVRRTSSGRITQDSDHAVRIQVPFTGPNPDPKACWELLRPHMLGEVRIAVQQLPGADTVFLAVSMGPLVVQDHVVMEMFPLAYRQADTEMGEGHEFPDVTEFTWEEHLQGGEGDGDAYYTFQLED